MRCESCHEYVMELFPANRRDPETRKVIGVMLCRSCVPKCTHLGPAGLQVALCGQPRDHRSEHFCTFHEIEVAKWGLERAGDDLEAIAEYRQTIAALSGEEEVRIAA